MFEFYYTVSSDDIRSYMPNVPVLFPASSFVQKSAKSGKYYLRVPNIPKHISRCAADCGGFVATLRWQEYRYSPEEYVQWLHNWPVSPQWAATMDYCCEDEITSGKPGIVRERQQLTTGMAYRFWDDYRDVPWVWVPTVQGWEVADYRRHAREMKPLIDEMRLHYAGRPFRVGIGTLCRRASAEMIRQVVNVVVTELGDVPVHLWGVKLSYLQSHVAMPEQIVSVDSAAWNGMFGRGIEEFHAQDLTRRRFLWSVKQPEYEKKVERALSEPKQHLLFGESEEVV